MEGLLKDKVCIVTGAAQGIGRSIVEKFSANGAIVYAIDCREGSLEWINEFPKDLSLEIHPLYLDICDFAAVKKAVMDIKKEKGKIDVLVNNAGLISYEFLSMIDFDKLRKMFEVNVIALIYMLQLVSRIMMRQNSGSIINMASIVGWKGAKGQLAYSATKGAVISTTLSAAKELAENKIRVNAIAPAMVGTERFKAVLESRFKEKINDVPWGRLAKPEEIADTCLYLASDMSSYVTGQIIGIDGGANI